MYIVDMLLRFDLCVMCIDLFLMLFDSSIYFLFQFSAVRRDRHSSIRRQSQMCIRDRYGGCMVYGVWCMVYGVWCMVYGVWCIVYGVWCMVCGVWCMVYDVWCMMYVATADASDE